MHVCWTRCAACKNTADGMARLRMYHLLKDHGDGGRCLSFGEGHTYASLKRDKGASKGAKGQLAILWFLGKSWSKFPNTFLGP